MTLYNIFVVNTAPGCDTEVQQQVSVSGCTTYIVRLSQNSNALGPFDVYQGTSVFLSAATLVASAQTRTQMFNGIVVSFECATPTPTPTPSATPPAATPTQTPTTTETPSPTPTFTSTPTNTPTFTPSESPTPSPTPTFTSTPTNNPTPSSTPTNFDIEIFTQDGFQLITQDGNPLILQQQVTSYMVSSGDSICSTGSYTFTQTIYSAEDDWFAAINFFTDNQLTIPFNGNNLWYTNESGGCGMYQIGTDGYVIGGICNPC